MFTLRPLIILFAASHAAAHESPFNPLRLFRRTDWDAMGEEFWKEAVKDVDFTNPDMYKDVKDWGFGKSEGEVQVHTHVEVSSGDSSDSGSDSSPPPSQTKPADSTVTEVTAPSTDKDSKDDSGLDLGDLGDAVEFLKGLANPNKKCGSSSASCPSNCAMTVQFTDDSLDVDYTTGKSGPTQTGNGGIQTGKTKNSCVCLPGGSVRVHVGTTDHSTHGTLIEGFAAGLGDASYWDVSNVEGYNYPVVCWDKNDPSRMSGSNIDLYNPPKGVFQDLMELSGLSGLNKREFDKQHKCSDSSATKMGDICVNDGYKKLVGSNGQKDIECWKCTLPSMFFAPIAGASYTYPYDDCGCASNRFKIGDYGSPMANGGELVCCVGPQCCPNKMSYGGQTIKGNCNRPDCTPCADSPGPHDTCNSACQVGAPKGTWKRHQHQHRHHH